MVRGKWAVSCFCSPPPSRVSAAATTRAATISGAMNFFTALISTHRILRDGREVLDVGVEPRARTEGVGEDPVERRHQAQAVVEVVLVLVQHLHHPLERG